MLFEARDDGTADFQITQSAVAAAGTASGTFPPGSSAPPSRASTATIRMADTPYGASNPKTVTDASGQTRVVAARPTGFCGRRVFIVTQNGNAYQGSSKGVLFTSGPFGANNQPSNEIPN